MPQAFNQPMQRTASNCNNIFQVAREPDHYLKQCNKLREKQRTAVELLLRGLRDQDVAAQLGVDRSTIHRWRRSPRVQRELDRQRRMLWERSAGQIQSLVEPALAVLRKQFNSEDQKSALRAAGVLLRFATPSRLAPVQGRNVTPPARDRNRQLTDALIAYIDSPISGQAQTLKRIDDKGDSEQ